MILNEKGKPLKSCSKYIGMRTNNQTEYHALISALESASKLTQQGVTCYLDSELVVKQLNGAYQVRNPTLKALWLKVSELARRFQRISFTHVPRTDRYIQEVDRLANQTLEEIG
jgi:ribonuclease HI